MQKARDLFDVAMGAYGDTEVCKLIETILLESSFRNKSGTQSGKKSKNYLKNMTTCCYK